MGFTPEQERAIEAQGKVIVSASAGSGKTTVMIEKIIGLITSGVGVDRILAVTFTNKAAASMKEKLSKAIIKKINEPETTAKQRKELKEQLAKVPTADISTIHSYCSKLIRTHFYKAEVDSAFRVIGGDDAEGRTLKSAALDELLEIGYKEQDYKFLRLLSVYFRKKKDATLREAMLVSYNKLRERADYERYLQKVSLGYTEVDFDDVCRDLLVLFQRKCKYYYELVEDERAKFMDLGDSAKQVALCDELLGWLDEGMACPDYFEGKKIPRPEFTTNSGSKKDSAEKKWRRERLTVLKKRVVAAFEDEFDDLLSRKEELANFLSAGETAAALASYLLRFDEKYSARKDERGVLDYNDLEHKALKLLSDEEIAKATREKYLYVFVDEYQDVNPVQEALISRLTGENLFLVGDVKQSIYGFRGSQSRFFVDKSKAFEAGEGTSLRMSSNFRSTDKVLDAINTQFSLAMTESVCSVDYEDDGFMEKGTRYRRDDGTVYDEGRVLVHFAPKAEEEKKQPRGVYSVRANTSPKIPKSTPTSDLLIRIIREEMQGFIEEKDGKKRPVRYSDIAILTRKTGGAIAEQAAALADAGIPVTTASAVNICDYSEVKMLIDILSLIDNAEQDIPLCSALLSPMGGLTADELAEIRLAYRGAHFRKACKAYAYNQEDEIAQKLRNFFAYLQRLRIECCVMTAGEILCKIIAETRMEAELLSRASGVACLKRIRRFIEEASAFDGYCVHDFLEYLRNLNYRIDYCENGGEDSVKILTIHASKGLEYPIVLLPNLNQNFKGGMTPDVYVEEKYGLAPRSFDTENMIHSSNLLRRLHEKKEGENAIADELNLYYVALTRAERALHLIFSNSTPIADVKYAKSYAEMTDFEAWEEYCVEDIEMFVEKQRGDKVTPPADEYKVAEVMRAYEWEYAHTGYENFPVKSSPTQLLEDGKYIPAQGFAEYNKGDEEEPTELMEGETRDLVVATGTAYHAFLERFDFGLLVDEQGKPISKAFLEGLVEDALGCFVGEVEVALLSKDKLVEILSNPVFYELQDMRLYKEQPFLASLPVKDTYAQKKDADPALKEKEDGEEIIFQGVIDLLAVGDCVRVIDYKYSTRGADALKNHYALQLQLYRLAVAKVLRIPAENIRCTIVNIRRGFQVDID